MFFFLGNFTDEHFLLKQVRGLLRFLNFENSYLFIPDPVPPVLVEVLVAGAEHYSTSRGWDAAHPTEK